MKTLCFKGIKINSMLVIKPCNTRTKALPLNVSKCDNTERCYNDNHNLGKLSDISYANLADAIQNFKNTSYTTKVYSSLENNNIYLSYDTKYNPVITHRVSKQVIESKTYYKYVAVDSHGKLIQLTTIKVT